MPQKKTDVKPLLDAIAVIQDYTVERSETPASRQARLELERENNKREDERERLSMKIGAWMTGLVLLAAIVLCALFLHYEKPEMAEKIVVAVLGLAGGFGLGRSTAKS